MRSQSFTNPLPLIITFLATMMYFTHPLGDADLGWHLKYGEYVLKTGQIMRDNQFSWQMPTYQWANHSWGFDVIIATLFAGHQFWLVSLTGGLIIALSTLIILPITSWGTGISLALFWLFGNELLNTGLRSDYFSLLATAILWRYLIRWFTTSTQSAFPNQLFIILPLIFMVWANLHGQFMLGLGLLGLVCISRWRERRFLYLISLCFLATLINPFTYHLWTTAASHLNAPELKYIYEWSPWPLTSLRMVLLLAYTSFVWIGVKVTKQPRTIIIPLAAMTLLGLTQRRLIPYFLLISLPIVQIYIDHVLQKRISTPWHLRGRWMVSGALMIWAVTAFIPRQIFQQNWNQYCHTQVYCSEVATQFIRDHHLQGKLWNAYRLGGYLIYRLPEIKPMIDGRMTLWHRDDGTSPFLEYTTMVYAQSGSKQLFDQINPDYVLIQPQYALAKVLATQEQWPIIFSDEQVVLFQNPQTSSATFSH